MGFEIFHSNSDHYDGMFELHESCFDGNELMHKSLFLEEITNETRVYYVVLNEGKVVGYAGAWNTGDDYSIISVATDKNFRRQGIATKLIKRLILDAKEKNINARIIITQDESVDKGSCIVIANNGVIDANFKSQLAVLQNTFGIYKGGL